VTRRVRTLADAPRSFLDARTGLPAYGAYAGELPRVTFDDVGLASRVLRRKRWLYVAISTPETWLAFAVVRTGYAATGFVFAYDLGERRMLVDHTAMAPVTAARIADDAHAAGEVARFEFRGDRFVIERHGGVLEAHVAMRGARVEATVDERSGAPPVAVIAPLGEGLVDATVKRVLLPARGHMRCGAREISLDGGFAGYDYTQGLLPRRTRWRWAFAQGRDESGEEIGLNLVSGFVGEAECAAFTATSVLPLAEPQFTFDVTRPERPWRLEGDGVDLTFAPGAVHAQRTNLLLVRSQFVQPVGTFTGTLRLGARDVRLRELPGVVENQDVTW